jgi:PAS domain-containing protein
MRLRLNYWCQTRRIDRIWFLWLLYTTKYGEKFEEVFSNGFVIDSPLTLVTKTELTDVLFNGSVYKNDEGKVLGIVIVARDVTKQAALYTRSILEASLDPLVTINAGRKITDGNHALMITGINRNRLFHLQSNAPDKLIFSIWKKFVWLLTIKHLNGKLTDMYYRVYIRRQRRRTVFAAARDVTAN